MPSHQFRWAYPQADEGAPGLRREEVAQLTGMSTTWYTWLEQGRDVHVSTQVLDSLARVLDLDMNEKAHLFALAAQPLARDKHATDFRGCLSASTREQDLAGRAKTLTNFGDVLLRPARYEATGASSRHLTQFGRCATPHIPVALPH